MTRRLRRIWRLRPVGCVAGLTLITIVVLCTTVQLWGSDPNQMDAVHRLLPPSPRHWFGTDNFGRDIFTRVIAGGQVSLTIGVAVMCTTSLFGTTLGLIAGYYPRIGSVICRVLDGLMAFPAILLAIALVGALGANLWNEIIALTVVYTPRTTRLLRAAALQLRSAQYVEAASAVGASDFRILIQHIFPNATAPLIVQSTFICAEAILADASLSFLGLGVRPPTPTWGNMLGEGRVYLTVGPWFTIFPGIAIIVSVLALNFVGDTVRDLLDPFSSGRSPTDEASRGSDEMQAVSRELSAA